MLNREQAAKLGTLTHNRAFSPQEAREYGLLVPISWLLQRKYIERVSRGQYVLTVSGEQRLRIKLGLDKE